MTDSNEIESQGIFITAEGIDCSGKSTVIRAVEADLRLRAVDVELTREPGGTEAGEAIREVLFTNKMSYEAELMLFYGARIEHCKKRIQPALDAGRVVLSDRYYDSTYAYQGLDCTKFLDAIHNQLLNSRHIVKPDLTLLFDIDVTTYLDRRAERGIVKGEEVNQFEDNTLDFFRKSRQMFLSRAAFEPDRFIVIDARRSLEEVVEDAQSAVRRKLNL